MIGRGACVESCPAELHEEAPLRLTVALELRNPDVDQALFAAQDDIPAAAKLGGQGKLLGEDIHGAERDHGQPRLLEPAFNQSEAIEHFVEGAVTACGDNGLESFLDRFRRDAGGRMRRIGGPEDGAVIEPIAMFEKALGLAALCDWIVDDADAAHGRWTGKLVCRWFVGPSPSLDGLSIVEAIPSQQG